jgi:predicted TIM-barrel fold metal-dependent hydrolase
VATVPSAPTDHYTLISADCHAGGSHDQYREYLDPAYRDRFDEWRGGYRNPFRDLGDQRKLRNWDDELRIGQQEADGVVAEVVFPNTIPPFFPSFVLFAGPPPPEDYELRLAGIRAHNRWLVDWCDRYPDQRAGIGQIFLNDVDDAIADARWIAEHGLRGGVLLPNVPPDCTWVAPLHHPVYEPLWSELESLGLPVNVHGGTGLPDYGAFPHSLLLYLVEVPFYAQRPLVHLLLSGVFERHPDLRFVITESGAEWIVPLVERLDGIIETIRATGATGELRFAEDAVLAHTATEYVQRNVWMGVSQPSPADLTALDVLGEDRFMWGSDYPHDEGTHPFTVEGLRALFAGMDPARIHQLVASNAAGLYGFDLDALAPIAERVGPTVAEVATPLDELPADANDALRKAAAAV